MNLAGVKILIDSYLHSFIIGTFWLNKNFQLSTSHWKSHRKLPQRIAAANKISGHIAHHGEVDQDRGKPFIGTIRI